MCTVMHHRVAANTPCKHMEGNAAAAALFGLFDPFRAACSLFSRVCM